MASLRTRAADRAHRTLPFVVVVLAASVAGCGSGDESTSSTEAADGTQTIDISGTEPLGEQTAGSVAQLAQCRDWNRGTEAEKLATIADVRGQVNREDTGVDAPPLSDDEAMEVFERACEADYAQGFRLHVIYARAAGVQPLLRDQPAE